MPAIKSICYQGDESVDGLLFAALWRGPCGIDHGSLGFCWIMSQSMDDGIGRSISCLFKNIRK